jgi:hypothetical protein
MAPAVPPAMPTPSPGAMTVPFLFGWEHVMTALLLVIALAVVFFVVAAAGRNASEQAEFQAWLDTRSNGRPDPVTSGVAGRADRSQPTDGAGPLPS